MSEMKDLKRRREGDEAVTRVRNYAGGDEMKDLKSRAAVHRPYAFFRNGLEMVTTPARHCKACGRTVGLIVLSLLLKLS